MDDKKRNQATQTIKLMKITYSRLNQIFHGMINYSGIYRVRSSKTILIFLISMIFLAFTATAQTPEDKLLGLGITLPKVPKAIGAYTNLVKVGHLLYLSGRGPLLPDGGYLIGKLGKDLDAAQGYNAAKFCAIAQLAVLKDELGELSKIRRIVKISGFVNGTDSFADQSKVMNGCSELMMEVFGKVGIHARSAIGVASLPLGWPVEIEMIIEVDD